jgi:maltokinase
MTSDAEGDVITQLADLLREWLPKQRWFAGKDREARSIRVVSRRDLAISAVDSDDAGPTLLHLILDIDGTVYQILIGVRPELPAQLDHALVGHLEGFGMLYDATHDQTIMRQILVWIRDDVALDGVTFRPEPGAAIDVDAPSLVLVGEQSNTSVVYGEHAILKLFRILAPGTNPDLEITRALTEIGNPHVAAVRGWIEAPLEGVPTTLGVLQEFLRNGSDGWALALTSVRDLFAEGDLHAGEVGGDFAAESERLGIATADVHLALAQALPTSVAASRAVSELVASMRARLAAAASSVPNLQPHAAAIDSVFDALASSQEPLQLQRVHGDYHLGQVMRTEAGWVLLDFEGEPGAPIEERAALSSPLRDVAGMLRSFDYASRYLLADHPGAPQLEYRATEWADRNRDAFCVGYAKAAGRDPREEHLLLRAFQLDKAVYEVVYEARNRPGWVHIPLGSIERLLAA